MLIIRENWHSQIGYVSALEVNDVEASYKPIPCTHISEPGQWWWWWLFSSLYAHEIPQIIPYIFSPEDMLVWKCDLQALNQTQRNVSGLLLAKSFFPCSLMKDWKAKRGLIGLFLAIASLFKQWLDAFCRKKRKHMDWISPKCTVA